MLKPLTLQPEPSSFLVDHKMITKQSNLEQLTESECKISSLAITFLHSEGFVQQYKFSTNKEEYLTLAKDPADSQCFRVNCYTSRGEQKSAPQEVSFYIDEVGQYVFIHYRLAKVLAVQV